MVQTMTIAPGVTDRDVSMPTEIPIFRALLALWAYALERPAVFGAIAYLYVSAIGLLYNAVYFRGFDIDVLAFYEVGDFLLAGLRRPLILLIPIAIVAASILLGVVTVVLDRLHKRFRRELESSLSSAGGRRAWAATLDRRYNDVNERWNRRTMLLDRHLLTIYLVLAVVLSASVVISLATADASEITRQSRRHCVYTEESGTRPVAGPAFYIGSTQAVYFFLSEGALHLVPRDRVTRITRVDPPASGQCAALAG